MQYIGVWIRIDYIGGSIPLNSAHKRPVIHFDPSRSLGEIEDPPMLIDRKTGIVGKTGAITCDVMGPYMTRIDDLNDGSYFNPLKRRPKRRCSR